jgi:hypothetical protein
MAKPLPAQKMPASNDYTVEKYCADELSQTTSVEDGMRKEHVTKEVVVSSQTLLGQLVTPATRAREPFEQIGESLKAVDRSRRARRSRGESKFAK